LSVVAQKSSMRNYWLTFCWWWKWCQQRSDNKNWNL